MRSALRHRAGPQIREHVRHVVRLAEFDALVAQDRVRGDHVEVELRQRPVARVLLARHVEDDTVGQFERNRQYAALVERVRRQAVEQRKRVGKARLRIGPRARLRVGIPSFLPHRQQRVRKRFAAQPADGLKRLKAGEPDLGRERIHVRRKPLRQQRIRLGAGRLPMGGGLVEPRRQATQKLGEGRDEKLGQRHEILR